MADIPIMFSAPMVRALLDGRKTMTRRMAWRGNGPGCHECGVHHPATVLDGCRFKSAIPSPWQRVKPGDRLWVRENFTLVGGDPGSPIYAANWREDAEARGFENIPATAPKWTPCIHMPRWASRLTLVVTATKIERLQEISEDDARAEGWPGNPEPPYGCHHPRLWFKILCSDLHGPDAWDQNPELVALTFTVHKANIDAMQEVLVTELPKRARRGKA